MAMIVSTWVRPQVVMVAIPVQEGVQQNQTSWLKIVGTPVELQLGASWPSGLSVAKVLSKLKLPVPAIWVGLAQLSLGDGCAAAPPAQNPIPAHARASLLKARM